MAVSAPSNAQITKWGYNTISKQVFSPIILGVVMFALAGTTDWLWGWVFNVVHLLAWVMMTVVLIRWNPELLNARGKRQAGAKGWDYVVLMIYGIAWIVMIVLGALDRRYGWTGPISPVWYVLGNALILIGFALTSWAMAVNRNFEVAVRIQDDRGHHVISSGPYRYVRHPGYTGVIIAFYFGMPLALGSWPAAVMALIGLVSIVIRTALEDRTLQKELPGYTEFTRQTRSRLIPRVW
ncbi:MAG: isoprenylcysteine carboxylmethyltransferase family protein [Anaerolineae bacterium]|nr:isoprenylcysteine carboxylmethyltransferase family protein [Anaerolineae bacterium]